MVYMESKDRYIFQNLSKVIVDRTSSNPYTPGPHISS